MLRKLTVLRYGRSQKLVLLLFQYVLLSVCNMLHWYLQLWCDMFTIQAQMVQHCHAPINDQLAPLYTRKVYLEYRQVFDKNTSFRKDPNSDMPNRFLVKHQRGGGGFCWSSHAFRVHANVEKGEYQCECRQWEHTDKLLMIKTLCYICCMIFVVVRNGEWNMFHFRAFLHAPCQNIHSTPHEKDI
jgi:hypothetical protein